MKKINTILLYDQDAEICYAVIRTKESPSKIKEIINKVKDSMPEEWTYDDLMFGLMDSGIDYEIDEDVHYVSY